VSEPVEVEHQPLTGLVGDGADLVDVGADGGGEHRYSKAPGFLGTKAPDRLASRYLRSLGLEGLSDEQLLSL